MFTAAQLDALHARLGRADSLGEYFRALAAIGVTRFESFVTDGHTEFHGDDETRVVTPAHHETMNVAETSDAVAALDHLRRHGNGETTYVEMSAGLAACGVEKWVADTAALTMTYRDRAGHDLHVEQID